VALLAALNLKNLQARQGRLESGVFQLSNVAHEISLGKGSGPVRPARAKGTLPPMNHHIATPPTMSALSVINIAASKQLLVMACAVLASCRHGRWHERQRHHPVN
jgi:hypothetical protein